MAKDCEEKGKQMTIMLEYMAEVYTKMSSIQFRDEERIDKIHDELHTVIEHIREEEGYIEQLRKETEH